MGGFVPTYQTKHLLGIVSIALIIVIFHWLNIKKNGARFILRVLNAQEPDKDDLYHRKLINMVQEVALGAGFKKPLKPYVVPSSAVNSFALVDTKRGGIVGVTEGAIAVLERDELQTVIAHELSHIMRGDAFYVTLVCSLTNFLNSIAEYIQPKGDRDRRIFSEYQDNAQATAAQFLLYFLVKMIYGTMKMLSLLISRQREYLADASAVEFTRNPDSLARAIYKAHKYFSFIGDYTQTYSPIFIVAPESLGEVTKDNVFKRMFSTHPPDRARIEKLLIMTGGTYDDLSREVVSKEKIKDTAREEIKSVDEEKGEIVGVPISLFGIGELVESIKGKSFQTKTNGAKAKGKFWEVRDCHGQWLGPFRTNELFGIPWFTGLSRVRPAGKEIELTARSFPEILEGFKNVGTSSFGKGECPFCQTQLINCYYEGVPIKICHKCGGRLIGKDKIMRIISRKGIRASDFLKEKTRQWVKNNYLNPEKVGKFDRSSPNYLKDEKSHYSCPQCGAIMRRRPFSLQYFILVDDCGFCKSLWFDGDELEMLQVIIEEKMMR